MNPNIAKILFVTKKDGPHCVSQTLPLCAHIQPVYKGRKFHWTTGVSCKSSDGYHEHDEGRFRVSSPSYDMHRLVLFCHLP